MLLATDPDREGESISLHLQGSAEAEGAGPAGRRSTRSPARRSKRRSPTRTTSTRTWSRRRRAAASSTGCTATRCRPVLWKKVRTGLSAGRVQSVAVRLIVEREEARRAFRSSTYWDVEARLAAEGREFGATLARVGDERVATGRDFDSATGALSAKARAAPRRAGGASAGRTLLGAAPAVERDRGRREAGHRAAGAAVHHLDADAGGEPQARVLDQPDDADRAAAEGRRRAGRRDDRRDHHLPPDRLDDAQREGAARVGRAPSARCSATSTTRGRAATRRRCGTRRRRTKRSGRPTSRLTPQSLAGVLDADELRLYELIWKRTMASQMPDARVLQDDRRVHGGRARRRAVRAHGHRQGDRVRRLPPRVRRGQRRPGQRARGAGDDPAGVQGGRPGRRGSGRRADGAAGHGRAGRPRAEAARDDAAGAVHRGVAHQEARRGGDRPAVHLRADDRDDPAARLRVPPGQGARAELHGVRGHRAAARPLRRLRGHRLHRGDGEGPRRDLERRASVARFHPRVLPRRRQAAQGPRGDGARRGAEHRLPGDRHRRRSRRAGSEIRVRIGRFGPFLQVGRRRRRATPRRCPTTCAPADLTVEKAMSLMRAKAAGPRELGVDPATGQNVYLATGRFGPYVQLGETPEKPAEGREGARRRRREAAAGVAADGRHRGAMSTCRWRCGCSACRACWARTRTTARRSSRASGGSGRT